MLDEESKQFIKFALAKMDDKLFAKALGIKAVYRLVRFYNSGNFNELLRKKLIKGGLEHGNPLKHTKRDVRREVREEMIDLIGWSLLELYGRHKKRIK